MGALRQRGGSFRQRPVAAGVGGDGAHQRDAIVDPYRCIRFGGPAQRRTRVVGRVGAGNRADDAADIINHRADDRRGRGKGINVNRISGGWRAGVACGIGGGKG